MQNNKTIKKHFSDYLFETGLYNNHYNLKHQKTNKQDYYLIVESDLKESSIAEKVIEWMSINRNVDKQKKKLVLAVSNKHFKMCQNLMKVWCIDGKLITI